MEITNVRLGFATNSSSSHSILILSDHHQVDKGWDGDDFGWEAFTLASERLKRSYLAGQLAPALGYRWWPQDADTMRQNARALDTLESLLGVKLSGLPAQVDHQSTWDIPRDWKNPEAVDVAFVDYIQTFLERDDVLVLGGNDNGGTHPLLQEGDDWRTHAPEGGRLLDLATYGMFGAVARQNLDHPDAWTFFNRRTGAKMRVWFGPSGTEEPARAFAPELVDIKITDYCPFACAFCYQDSTLEGRHASTEDVRFIARELGKAKVFEVAIGGGEPTLHPRFVEILGAFRTEGIVPNFTTRNLGWLRDEEFVHDVRQGAGTFAYSVQTPKEIDDFAAAVAEHWGGKEDWDDKAPNVHIVMGIQPKAVFRAMLQRCNEHNITPTLLGYKRVGRAGRIQYPYLNWWLQEVLDAGLYRIGIDTALAAESEKQLLDNDIPRWRFHTEDGNFSAYIDAVSMQMGPSSWEPQRPSWEFAADWRQGWSACA